MPTAKKSPTAKMNSTPTPTAQAAKRFVAEMDKSISFHQNNTNDPNGIGMSVMIALVETRNAFARANRLPVLKK